jgi:hypothetical protein
VAPGDELRDGKDDITVARAGELRDRDDDGADDRGGTRG